MHTVNLNIVLTYPVKWSKKEVLRDLVQNFYDDAGAEQFGNKFRHTFVPNDAREDSETHEIHEAHSDAGSVDKNGTIVMSMDSDGFSYEWLIHIGASTKQKQSGKYAGYFGEGFKIASLCAVRDHDWDIRIRSRNWSLHIIVLDMEIDGEILKQLAYRVSETPAPENTAKNNETVLEIAGTSVDDYVCLEEVIMGFYYPENPLIGELIFSDRYVAIHRRSSMEKPASLPTSFDCDGDDRISGERLLLQLARPMQSSF
jgi:hypothetical protein